MGAEGVVMDDPLGIEVIGVLRAERWASVLSVWGACGCVKLCRLGLVGQMVSALWGIGAGRIVPRVSVRWCAFIARAWA